MPKISNFVRGYDFACEQIKLFIDNIDLYEKEFEDAGIDINSIDGEYINNNEYYTDPDTLTYQSDETKLVDTVLRCLFAYMILEREDIGGGKK